MTTKEELPENGKEVYERSALWAAVKANTSPISSAEFEKLMTHRGELSKGNASADPSALDAVGLSELQNQQAPIQSVLEDPLVTLILGGIEGGEYDSWDLEVISGKRIDDLQNELVKDSEPVLVHLYRTPPAAPTLTDKIERPIEKLLDAAFSALQHDTGPDDPEYRHQRKHLAIEFVKILRHPAAHLARKG